MARQRVFIFAIIALVLAKNTFAKEFIVGDEDGWTTKFDYASWAKDKDFRVGDTLVFKYPAGVHNVIEVDENAYKNCILPSDNEGLTSGKDTITLDKPGKQWFLCSVGLHCEKGGQKLQVEVKDSSSRNKEDAAAPTAVPSQAPAASESSSTGTPPQVAEVSSSSDGAAAPSPSENSSNGVRKTGYQQLPLAIMISIVALVV